jgi:thiol-disulfide isomerase/thioredoxin
MRAILAAGLAVLLCLSASAQATGPELKVITYADLGKVIRANRGKVIVVDVWASWCGPCKKKFPDFLALHAKYADKGLVCLSVALDDAEEEKAALAFLTKVKSTIPNYRLSEGKEAGFKKFGLQSIPAVYVFDRDNRRAVKLSNDDPDKDPFTYEKDIEPLVARLLEK